MSCRCVKHSKCAKQWSSERKALKLLLEAVQECYALADGTVLNATGLEAGICDITHTAIVQAEALIVR